MNIPNKLTVLRLILAPVIFIWFYSIEFVTGLSSGFYSAVLIILFVVAETTDYIDGRIARSCNLVTDLGKVMDPFGDVVCHLTYFTCFLVAGLMPAWCFIIILWREFSQSFIRMLLMGKGKAMPANAFGKAKTTFYAFTSLAGFVLRCLFLSGIECNWLITVMLILCIGSALSSLLSFIIYMKDVVKSGVLSSMTR